MRLKWRDRSLILSLDRPNTAVDKQFNVSFRVSEALWSLSLSYRSGSLGVKDWPFMYTTGSWKTSIAGEMTSRTHLGEFIDMLLQ